MNALGLNNYKKYNREKRKAIIIFLIGCLIALTIWLYWGNNSIEVTRHIINDTLIPESFDDFTIVHVSDLHNKEFGKQQYKLLDKIKAENPDIIAITGDIIDSRRTNIEKALTLVKEAVKIAPVYYVTGNHEARTESYKELKKQLLQLGVIILDDNMVSVTKGNSTMQLIGLNDPDFNIKNDWFGETGAMIDSKLQNTVKKDSTYKILLSHRPELVDVYAKHSINLVLSGHAHGGQFRIPFIGGVIAPNQGFFPKFTEGMYNVDGTKMIVSRGLGNSVIPIRINNRPELITITLKHNK